MEYPVVLGILAAFFGLIGAFAVSLRSPEPPPKGGVRQSGRARVSFREYHKIKASQRPQDAILAERRSA